MADLSIIVAVDAHGAGYVLSFRGKKDRTPGGGLSQHKCFAEEVSNCGRFCEDLLLDNPAAVGVHRFDGSLGYNGPGEDAEPVYLGTWTTVYTLPEEFRCAS